MVSVTHMINPVSVLAYWLFLAPDPAIAGVCGMNQQMDFSLPLPPPYLPYPLSFSVSPSPSFSLFFSPSFSLFLSPSASLSLPCSGQIEWWIGQVFCVTPKKIFRNSSQSLLILSPASENIGMGKKREMVYEVPSLCLLQEDHHYCRKHCFSLMHVLESVEEWHSWQMMCVEQMQKSNLWCWTSQPQKCIHWEINDETRSTTLPKEYLVPTV